MRRACDRKRAAVRLVPDIAQGCAALMQSVHYGEIGFVPLRKRRVRRVKRNGGS